MKLSRLSFGLGIATLLNSCLAFAALDAVTFSSTDHFPAPRWMYGVGEKPNLMGHDPVTLLERTRDAQIAMKYDVCVSEARTARNKAKSLEAWLATAEADCASADVKTSAAAARLEQTLASIDKHPAWLLQGAQAPKLRASVAHAYLALIEQDTKTNRTRAWISIDKAEELASFMDDKARANLWRLAGELSFIQQKPEAARDFFKRSLLETPTDQARLRLAIVEAELSGREKRDPLLSASPKPTPSASPILETTTVEQELVDHATNELKSGDLQNAHLDALKIIRDDPGGTRANWASDRALEVYFSVNDKHDPKLEPLRQQFLQNFETADSDRIAEWARVLFNRGCYEDSLVLSRKALESSSGARRTHVLEIASDAAFALEKFEETQTYNRELITKSAGQPASREALFRSGLISYQLAEYGQAIADFERLVMLPQTENLEVSARYWMWRSLQKAKSDRATAVGEELMHKFPFSYYGLRVRMEKNGGGLDWKPPVVKVESKLWLTGPEKMAWEKTLILMKAGWLEEAQAEIKELPPAFRADDRAVRALILAAAGSYPQASRLANEAWDEKAELRRPPMTGAAFPREFSPFIIAEAKARKVDPDLVRGLIKQESSYNIKAMSTSGAMGLMQMIPPTAKDIASELKLGNLVLPNDMFEPKRNIAMGTYYLSRMLDHYRGSVPLALASYNAGPARMDRWLAGRPSLKDLATKRSSSPDDEIWFDEIPYRETQFYVKAILRNVLLYKLLDEGRVPPSDPIWAFSPEGASPKTQ